MCVVFCVVLRWVGVVCVCDLGLVSVVVVVCVLRWWVLVCCVCVVLWFVL